MNKEQYQNLKEELLQLYKNVFQHEVLLPSGIADAEKSRRKLQEDAFEIVLIGEFQGGKSTTFNALCEGREISPRGPMIKTSASLITARNIENPKSPECAKITWKTDFEVFDSMSFFLIDRLVELDPNRFKEYQSAPDIIFGRQRDYSQFNFKKEPKPISLSDKKDLELIRRAFEKEWTYYTDNRLSYDGRDVGKSDMLKVAAITLHYLEDSFIVKYRAEGISNISLPQMAEYVTFPSDWAQWVDKKVPPFELSKVMFAFISRVDCYIHSSNLEKLGCVIVDCPGLFASEWDSKLAKKAMLDANAIIYLFGGERGIREEEEKALAEIMKLQKIKKNTNPLFVFNSHIPYQAATGVVKNDIVPKLNRYGFYDARIYIYHALLGLCAQNCSLLINDDGFTQQRFLECSRKFYELEPQSDIFEYWKEVSFDSLRAYRGRQSKELCQTIDSITDVEDITSVSEDLRYQSGLAEVIGAVEKELITGQKVRSLLLENGAQKLLMHIKDAEKKLINQIDLDRKDIKDIWLIYENAKQKLNDFLSKAQAIVEEEFSSPTLGCTLIDDFKNSVFDSNLLSQEIANDLAKDIINNKWLYTKGAIGKILGKQDIEERIKQRLEKVFSNHIKRNIETWLAKIAQGNNEAFNEEFRYYIKRICGRIIEEWNKNNSQNSSQFGFKLHELLLNSSSIHEVDGNNTIDPSIIAVGVLQAITGLLVSVISGVAVAKIVAFIGMTIVLNITGGWIIELAAFIVTCIASIVAGCEVGTWVLERIATRINNSIKDKIQTGTYSDKIQKILSDSGRQIVTELVKQTKQFFFGRFDKIKKEFEKEWMDYLDNARATTAEKEKRIERNTKILNDDVIPLKSKCEQYIIKTDKACHDA